MTHRDEANCHRTPGIEPSLEFYRRPESKTRLRRIREDAAARRIEDPAAPPERISFLGAPLTAVAILVILALELTASLDPALREAAARALAFWPGATLTALGQGSPAPLLQTVSHMLLHASLIHAAVNAGALAVFGAPAERFCRTPNYLLLLLATGVAGALAHLGWEAFASSLGSPIAALRLDSPLAGASGAICGLLGFELRRRSLALARRPARRRPISPKRLLLTGSLGFVLLGLMIGMIDPLTSTAAHLGGFAAGLLLAPALLRERAPLDEPRDRT